MTNQSEEKPVEVELISPRQQILLDMAEGWLRNSLTTIDEAAKQLITACSFFLGGYSFLLSGVEKSYFSQGLPVALVLPLIFLVLSVVSSIIAMMPLRIDVFLLDPTDVEVMYKKRLQIKGGALMVALGCFILAGFCSVYALT